MSATETYDVIVVGSGGAGALAALRAKELGLSVLIVEKAHKYGGTTATSGGVMWIPNNQLTPNDDNREQALEYLDSLIKSPVNRERLEAYVDRGAEVAKFMKSIGIPLVQATWPDYFAESPGARADRSLVCDTFDGRELGDKFVLMREQYSRFKLLRRYAMDLPEFFAVSTRGPGWIKALLKIFWRYWSDISTRMIGGRDRRLPRAGR